MRTRATGWDGDGDRRGRAARAMRMLAAAAIGAGLGGCGNDEGPGWSAGAGLDPAAVSLEPTARAATRRADDRPEVLASYDLGSAVRELAVSADGTLIAALADQAAAVFEARDGGARPALEQPPAAVHAGAFLPGSRRLAIAGSIFTPEYRAPVAVWDAETGKPGATLWNRPKATSALAFYPDGKTAAAALGPVVELIGVETGEAAATLSGHKGDVRLLAIAPDGRTLATAGSHTGRNFATVGELILWDVPEGRERARPELELGGVNALAFAPDGQTLALAFAAPDGSARLALLDPATGSPRAEPARLDEQAESLAFSPDGGTLAIGTRGGGVWLRDLARGSTRVVPGGHRSTVLAAAFAADGAVLATGGEDRTVILWDLVRLERAGAGEPPPR